MAIFIHNNLMARNAARILGENYAHLSDSMRRLSSGLRVNSAADDAAGLAIRELMRADIATYQRGIRNANDAISLIQTADGALSVIDEKLIRMKELAEQAATGTYNSVQRLLIDAEFQAMGAEIDRIARATDFNGIKLLDGSLSGPHDGSSLTSTGAMKIHFGPGNDLAEDYYYIDIGDCPCAGLGLSDGTGNAGGTGETGGTGGTTGTVGGGTTGNNLGNIPTISTIVSQNTRKEFANRNVAMFVIPSGTEGLSIHFEDGDINDDIQLFTPDGNHIVGTPLTSRGWGSQSFGSVTVVDYINNSVIISANGFDDNASYSDVNLNGGQSTLTFTPGHAGNDVSYNGMKIFYSGDGNPYGMISVNNGDPNEYLTIDKVTKDLIFCVAGDGPIAITATWTSMPTSLGGGGTGGTTPGTPTTLGTLLSIKTQELAQNALERIDDAIVTKDNVRAHLGAMQNRLENTVSNLSIQAENLQASESRISDVDVAEEMTKYICNQILTQSATAMLAQANSLPQMLVSLIEG